ncbi:MAG: STAS domain-containing protein [Pseudomonadota bacterium]
MSEARLEIDSAGLRLSGPLTLTSVAALDRCLRERAMTLPEHARVDLSAVERIDSAGVAFLVTLWRRARERGETLVFEPIPEDLAPLLELYDLEDIITDSAARASA